MTPSSRASALIESFSSPSRSAMRRAAATTASRVSPARWPGERAARAPVAAVGALSFLAAIVTQLYNVQLLLYTVQYDGQRGCSSEVRANRGGGAREPVADRVWRLGDELINFYAVEEVGRLTIADAACRASATRSRPTSRRSD